MKKGKCCIALLLTIIFLLFNYKPANAAVTVTTLPLSHNFFTIYNDGVRHPVYTLNSYWSDGDTFYAPSGSYIYGYRFTAREGGQVSISTATGQNFLVTHTGLQLAINNNWGSWIKFKSNTSPYYSYLVDFEIFIATPVADEATTIQARDASNNAALYASWANTNADQAKLNAWYSGAYGGPQESVANLAGYIRMSQHYNKF